MITDNATPGFNYEQAFSRNIGWVTPEEQAILNNKKIAIAGMGGVGGLHLLTHLRLGLSNFHIADFDSFELANFNRQVGATMETIGQPKAKTLKKLAQEINPNANIALYESAINDQSIPEFLDGVDIFVDGIDFFELDVRAKIFAACYERNIPAITAAPLGMGCAYLLFMPNKMTFEEYFRFNHKSYNQQLIQFIIGLSPKAPHQHYLALNDRLNLNEKRGPSTIMGCQLCASIAATEALKILLDRGPIYPAPYFHVFDAYQQYAKRQKLWFGNNHPIQRLKAYWLEKQFK